MNEIVYLVLCTIVQGVIYWLLGFMFQRVLRQKAGISFSMVAGFLLYFTLFECLYIPMMLLWVPLHIFSITWFCVLAAVILIFAVIVHRRKKQDDTRKYKEQSGQMAEIILEDAPALQKQQDIKSGRDFLKAHSYYIIILIGVVVLQCILVACSPSVDGDSAYYMGMTSTSVYTDSLGRYNPYTGALLNNFDVRYIFSGYIMNNAVWGQLFPIHPIVQSRICMPVLSVLVTNAAIYQLALRLFDQERRRADMMTGLFCLLQLFSYTSYTQGMFFFSRLDEGKGIVSNFVLFFCLMLAVWLWVDVDNYRIWIYYFLTTVAALTFSGSGIITAVAISTGVIPILIFKKRLKYIWKYMICMLPTVLYLLVYFLARNGYLVLKAS